MLRYADFLRAQLEMRGHSVRVMHPPALFGRKGGSERLVSKWLGYIDKFILFPPMLRLAARRADIVHVCDHSNSPYLAYTGSKPSLITCHDLLAIQGALGYFPSQPTGRTGKVLQRWILNGLSSAKNVVCVSHKTREDLTALLPHLTRTAVIPHSTNWQYGPATEAQIAEMRQSIGLQPHEEYLLHVGGNQWYKNRLGVLAIYAELRRVPRYQSLKLVMAGKEFSDAMKQFCAEQNLTGVVKIVNPSNLRLQALYSSALALLFPSLEEGFGWPILEAQACGCVVITTNRAPMTEVAGDGAIFINPQNPGQAAELIASGLQTSDVVRAAGSRNVQRFSLEAMMDRYCELYEAVAANGSERVAVPPL